VTPNKMDDLYLAALESCLLEERWLGRTRTKRELLPTKSVSRRRTRRDIQTVTSYVFLLGQYTLSPTILLEYRAL
jgi:hypothetical protein